MESASEKIQEVIPYGYFSIIKAGEQYHIVLGDQVVASRPFASPDEAKAHIESKPWDIIFSATQVFSDKIKQLKTQKNGN